MANRISSKKGQLKWKNIYYFLCYCIEELMFLNNTKIGFDKVSSLLDLMGVLLYESFNLVCIEGLYYKKKQEEINTDKPYGRLDLTKAISTGVYATGKMDCIVVRQNINNLVNQIIKTTIHKIITFDGDEKISDSDLIDKLGYEMSLLNSVDIIDLSNDVFDTIKNPDLNIPKYYKPVLYICDLIYKMYICKDSYDDVQTPITSLEERLCYIWEKYINNLLARKLSGFSCKYQVFINRGRLDTLLESKTYNKAFIIDAKWYSTRTKPSNNYTTILGYCTLYTNYTNKQLDHATHAFLLYATDIHKTECDYSEIFEDVNGLKGEEWYINILDEKEIIESNILNIVRSNLDE